MDKSDEKARWVAGRPVTSDRAYGTSRDPHPFYEARIKVPTYLRQSGDELEAILNITHDALATRLYLLLLAGADFRTGEILTDYKRLRAMCCPPRPQAGKRQYPWSYWQIRAAVAELEKLGLVWRDISRNEVLGELRLYVTPRAPGAEKKAHPKKETSGKSAGSS